MTELSDCEASKFNQIKFNRMLCLKISLSDVIVIDETAPPELKSENMYRMNEHKIKGIEIYSLIRINFFFFFFWQYSSSPNYCKREPKINQIQYHIDSSCGLRQLQMQCSAAAACRASTNWLE